MEATFRHVGLKELKHALSSKFMWLSWYFWPPHLSVPKVTYATDEKVAFFLRFLNLRLDNFPDNHVFRLCETTYNHSILNLVMDFHIFIISKSMLKRKDLICSHRNYSTLKGKLLAFVFQCVWVLLCLYWPWETRPHRRYGEEKIMYLCKTLSPFDSILLPP